MYIVVNTLLVGNYLGKMKVLFLNNQDTKGVYSYSRWITLPCIPVIPVDANTSTRLFQLTWTEYLRDAFHSWHILSEINKIIPYQCGRVNACRQQTAFLGDNSAHTVAKHSVNMQVKKNHKLTKWYYAKGYLKRTQKISTEKSMILRTQH